MRTQASSIEIAVCADRIGCHVAFHRVTIENASCGVGIVTKTETAGIAIAEIIAGREGRCIGVITNVHAGVFDSHQPACGLRDRTR